MSSRTLSFVAWPCLAILAHVVLPSQASQAADNARHYDVIATDGAFQPAVLNARPSERIHITVFNRGRTNHSIQFILPQGYIGIRGYIPPGRAMSVTFQAPKIPGQYVFYCPIFNHGALGMQGSLIVASEQ
jgi:plastocyanin